MTNRPSARRDRLRQLRPNARPIVRAKHLAGNLFGAFPLDEYAKLRAGFAPTSEHLVEVGVLDSASLRENLALSGFDVHAPHNSETLDERQVFRQTARVADCYNGPMDIYVQALRQLVDAMGGYEAVAEQAGLNPQSVYQVYSGVKLPSGNPKGVGPTMRRALDEAFPGWAKVASDTEAVIPHKTVTNKGDTERISEYETGGKMGAGGLVLRDQPGEIRGWEVTKEWLRKNVPNCTSHKNLAIVTGFGDSMRPLYNPGDPLLIDTGVVTVEYDAIYFFRVGDEGFIKRLQRIPGNGLVAISENPSYRDWTITSDMDFQVFGRVVKIWRGDDF